jgi:hypothetical protein
MPIGPDMRRWILNSVGAALLLIPLWLTRFGASNGLDTGREASPTAGMSGWLSLSITAGGYLLYWGPVLLGALVLFYANRRRG